MTDMTAEQALEWLESLHEIVQGNSISQNKCPDAQAAAKALRQALSAPEGAFRILVAAGNRIAAEAEEVEGDGGMAVQILLDYWHGFLTALERAKGSLTAATAPAEHVARVGTMEVTMDDECRVSRAVLRDAADVLRDYTDKPREAAPAPADSELARLRERYDALLAKHQEVLDTVQQCACAYDGPQDVCVGHAKDMSDLRERVKVLEGIVSDNHITIRKQHQALAFCESSAKGIVMQIVCIGGPLNDNKLQYSPQQLGIFHQINMLAAEIESAARLRGGSDE